MAREFEIHTPNKTYATHENVRKAINSYPNIRDNPNLHYFIMQSPDGRYFPVFVGESAIQAGAHFLFNVVDRP